MPPIVPENLSELTAAAATQLVKDIRTYAIGVLSAADSDEATRAEARELTAKIPAIERAGADAALAAQLAADDAAAEVVPEVEVVPAAEIEVVEPAAPELSTTPVPTTIGVQAAPASTSGVPTGTDMLAQFRSMGTLADKRAGSGFESWAELSQGMLTLGESITPGAGKKFELARMYGNFDEDHTIDTEQKLFNLSRMDPAEIQAAFCPPATPYYGLSCGNTMRRPVDASLTSFAAPRGRVSIPSSPTLSAITAQYPGAGYGQWTIDDDADANATKECAVVTCNDWDDFEMYAVWRCLTVKNMLMLTYPELVEHYIMLLGAAWARLAETLLLDAMATGTVLVNAPALGYGATTSLTTTLLHLLALHQESQRWDVDGGFDVWCHRIVLAGLKIDLMRRRQTNGNVPRIPSDAEIEAIFSNAGFNMHWTLDQASWMTPVASVRTGTTLNALPTQAQLLIAPRGKFAKIDRGSIALGVNSSNPYRDTASVQHNEFTMFWESFEGLVNTDSCPAYILNMPLCWNGVQVDDALVACNGTDEGGYQS